MKKKTAGKRTVLRVAPKKKTEKWSIKRIWLPLGLAMIALVAVPNMEITRDVQGSVLGEERDSRVEEQQREQQKEQEDQQKETQKRTEEQAREQNKANVQNRETEVRKNGTTVKTKTEDDGSRKVETENAGVRFTFQEHAGELKLQAVDDKGNRVATAEGKRKELETELEQEEVAIASRGGEVELEHNGQRVRTHFPLSVDPDTHELTVTTPAGSKTVTVLPDEAVNHMLERGFLTSVTSSSGSGETNGVSAALALTVHNDQSVYEIHGEKRAKFLGLFPVTLDRTAYVSTENGELVARRESVLSSILDFLSF